MEVKMMIKKEMSIGAMAFLVLTALGIMMGIGVPESWQTMAIIIMAIAGIVAGFSNVTKREVVPFLVSLIALVAGLGFGVMVIFDVINLGTMMTSVLINLVAAYAMMAVVIALTTIVRLGSKK